MEKTFWEKVKESIEIQKRLVTSTDYVEWLFDFTKKHPNFTDSDWLYNEDPEMSENDYSQVRFLTDFFTAIYQYHTRNLLKANGEGHTEWYNIKYKDAYFAIGIRVGQGAENFVKRYESYDAMAPESFIEFKDIMTNKEDAGLAEKNEALQKLQNEVSHVYGLGVPKAVVDNIIKQVFENKT